MRKISAICAVLAFIIVFGTNRPDYDSFYKTNPTQIHAVAISYNDDVKDKREIDYFKNCKITNKQLNNFIQDSQKKEKIRKEKYQKDLYLMASLVDAECGSSWLCDEQQMLTVCVVQNRIKSHLFPNTLHDVIYQRNPKQYESAWNGSLNKNPSDRALKNVKSVLDGKYTCPDKVLYQCEHIEGKVYKKFYNKYSGTTTYFCYSNK